MGVSPVGPSSRQQVALSSQFSASCCFKQKKKAGYNFSRLKLPKFFFLKKKGYSNIIMFRHFLVAGDFKNLTMRCFNHM